MEEYNKEKYMHLENVESLFKRINRFGNEYNYCFGCFIPPSNLALAFGAVGGAIDALRRKNLIGYFINKNEKEICLIPLISDNNKAIQIDVDDYIDILPQDIKSIKIKNEDFMYKRIIIKLNDKTKYVMKTAKKIKDVPYHENNLNKFIELYK